MIRIVCSSPAFTLSRAHSHRFLLRKAFGSESHDDFKPKKKVIPESSKEVINLIDSQVKGNPVMLYMKGTPAKPQVPLYKISFYFTLY